VWGLGATYSGDSGGTVVPGDGPSGGPPSAAASPDYMAEPAPTPRPSGEGEGGEEHTDPSAEDDGAPGTEFQESSEDVGQGAAPGEAPAGENEWAQGGSQPGAPERSTTTTAPEQISDESAPEEEVEGGGGGVVTGLVDGILGLLGGR
jgi:hypothetical protein